MSMRQISFKEFKALDLRIGKVIEAFRVEGSRHLIKMEVDFGTKKLHAVAGLAKKYKPEELQDKKYMFICNLEHMKIMGVESECMILAAEDGKGNVTLMQPEGEIEVGSKIS